MKEAAGEANMTVITIVLIAIVLGVGTLIVNNLMNSNTRSSACSAAGGTWQSGTCYQTSDCTGTNGECPTSAATLTWCENATVYVAPGGSCPSTTP